MQREWSQSNLIRIEDDSIAVYPCDLSCTFTPRPLVTSCSLLHPLLDHKVLMILALMSRQKGCRRSERTRQLISTRVSRDQPVKVKIQIPVVLVSCSLGFTFVDVRWRLYTLHSAKFPPSQCTSLHLHSPSIFAILASFVFRSRCFQEVLGSRKHSGSNL